ncbi:hypothetical protein [Aliidiomarina soli]|uniref:Solute-binding protein family 3/N-terminal domain-containing protein n=1 Tax=Aliidiomarina soli TaxID=1928574 RepID=A0A432WJ11_9GAMM|nr:hypothetical protein [Aliidiomarina soli]RUO33816.1 hypothetical protein CWE14_04960 [Aliidiomarina soli]
MRNMHNNSNALISILVLIIICYAPSKAYPADTVYAVIDLPPFGCQPSGNVECINTKYTQIVVNAIDDETDTIQAFPYPRALNMFETGQSPILIALTNKRLMKQAHVIELYSGDFYLVSMGLEVSLEGRTISYLRGADVQKEIASSVDATPFEVNDYRQMDMMIEANRLAYVIIPRYIYENKADSIFKNTEILSEHSLPILLYVNKNESNYLERIKTALSKTSLPSSEQYRHLFY